MFISIYKMEKVLWNQYLKWFTRQPKISGSSVNRLPWVELFVSCTSEVNTFVSPVCVYWYFPPNINSLRLFFPVKQWFNACTVVRSGNLESPVGLGYYLVQTRDFSFYRTNNYWISNLIFHFLRPINGPL